MILVKLFAKAALAFGVKPVRQTRSTYTKAIWHLMVTVLEFMLWPQVVEVGMVVAIRLQIVMETMLKTALMVGLLPRLTFGSSTALFQQQPYLLPEFMPFLAEAMAEMVVEIIRMVMRVTGLMAEMELQCMYQIPLHL